MTFLIPFPSRTHYRSVLSLSSPSISRFGLVGGFGELRKRGTNFHSCRAVERESDFEVDPNKAREALRKLDEQLKSLSQNNPTLQR